MTVRNPILAGFHPDPSWCRFGDDVLLVTSTFNWVPGLPIHRSRDLASWSLAGHALARARGARLDAAVDSGGLYAPTLRFIQGRLVLVCTTVLPDGSHSFVMTAHDPAGPWSEPRWVEEATGFDPDLFEDLDGTVWWTGTRLSEDPMWHDQTEIWTRPFDIDTARFTGGETVVWHGAVENAVWSEGPHLFRRGAYIYLLTAEGGTAEEHAVSVARARCVTGPWEGCRRNPVFTHRNLGRDHPVQDVGHADILQMPDGRWWSVMLGVRPVEGHHLLGRETFLCPLVWEDDWPVFAPGLGRLPEFVDPDGASTWVPASQRGRMPRWEDLDPHLFETEAIRPVGVDWGDETTTPFRGIRADSQTFGLAAALDPGETAPRPDLALVRDSGNWLRISATGGQVGAEVSVGGSVVSYEISAVSEPRPWLWLRLDGLRLDVGCGVSPGEGASRTFDARWLSTESAGGFVGCVAGLWEHPTGACASTEMRVMRDEGRAARHGVTSEGETRR